MDNCAIHHDEDIRALIEDECGMKTIKYNYLNIQITLLVLGARLIYLPPYSPDFNPIEEAFSKIKAALRRLDRHFTGPDQIPWLVQRAITTITPDDAIGWFTDCGYM
jgi:transposase